MGSRPPRRGPGRDGPPRLETRIRPAGHFHITKPSPLPSGALERFRGETAFTCPLPAGAMAAPGRRTRSYCPPRVVGLRQRTGWRTPSGRGDRRRRSSAALGDWRCGERERGLELSQTVHRCRRELGRNWPRALRSCGRDSLRASSHIPGRARSSAALRTRTTRPGLVRRRRRARSSCRLAGARGLPVGEHLQGRAAHCLSR